MPLPHRTCRTYLLCTCCLAGCGDDSSVGAGTSDGNIDDTTSTTTTTSTDLDPGPTTTSADALTTDEAIGTGTTTGTTTDTTTGQPCDQGDVVCDGDVAKVCDGRGGFSEETRCTGVCIAGAGCTLCEPGLATCDGDILKICSDDGSEEHEIECDGVQGLACDAGGRTCVGACAPDLLGAGSLGCDFYPTVTANGVKDKFAFAVVVANAGDAPAHVEIDKGAALVLMDTVAPHSVGVFDLPWDPELKTGPAPTASLHDVDGAYRLRSDAPVTVTQFSSIDFGVEPLDMAASNDASLLFPAHAWSTDYVVAAYNSLFYEAGNEKPGFYAVTASEDGTTVTVSPSATGDDVLPGAGVQADGTGQVVLDRGDVLEVFSQRTGQNPSTADVTGTRITADRPIQVLGGHLCTQVPYSLSACDHLEESMLPFHALAERYIVTAPRSTLAGLPRHQLVRIIATEADTQLGYDPPQPGAPTTIAEAGGYVELAATDRDFMISASAKVVVAQYMRSQKAYGGLGDPSLLLAVPPESFRDSYLFHMPSGYEGNFVSIIAPAEAEVTLDGLAVAGFEPIGGTSYGVARVDLGEGAAGQHTVAADVPVGVSVYGTGFCTSYWYQAGLDLGPATN